MDRVSHAVLGAGVTAVAHPVAYAKVLIQIGFEPMAPVPTTTLFGSKVLMYPNVFRYVGYIWEKDGFLGLYRGLGPRLMSGFVGNMVSNYVSSELTGQPVGVAPQEGDEVDAIKKLVKDTACETVARVAGIIASQPFHVIVVRSMAQFVGGETKYCSIYSSVTEIWTNEGISGFFSGVVPRLLGELLTIWLANVLTHTINTYLLPAPQPHDKGLSSYSNMVSQLVVTQITYPFSLVANVMAVNNSGLKAGQPPISPIYSSWCDCWSQLSRDNQLKRGSGLFWRVYKASSTSI